MCAIGRGFCKKRIAQFQLMRQLIISAFWHLPLLHERS